jgi:Cu(I)/Ag(I) efflux system membrane fusion protein
MSRVLAITAPAVAVLAALGLVLVFWGPRREAEQAKGAISTRSQPPMSTQAGIETEAVQYRELSKEIRTVGKLDYNERRVAVLTARVDGRVDRVFADFTGVTVEKGDHLIDIYSPALYSAQAELILALETAQGATGDRRSSASNLEAARTKLRLLGILPEQITDVERRRQVTSHLRIFAPIGGVVITKNVQAQQYVKEGDVLYRIAELNPIWLYLDIYEYDLAWIRRGQPVDVGVEAYPGETFHGTIVFIDPFLDDKTRAVKVRVNLKNPDGRLKAAMYATAVVRVRLRADGTAAPTGLEGKYICPMHPEVIQDAAGTCPICEMPLERVPQLGRIVEKLGRADAGAIDDGRVLAIRKSAVLDTGRRHVVYRQGTDGRFVLVEVTLGPLAESKVDGASVLYYPVLGGLAPGDNVVVQGGFLLDSQRQIEGMPSLLYEEGRSAAGLHAGHGGTAAQPEKGWQEAPAAPAGHKH